EMVGRRERRDLHPRRALRASRRRQLAEAHSLVRERRVRRLPRPRNTHTQCALALVLSRALGASILYTLNSHRRHSTRRLLEVGRPGYTACGLKSALGDESDELSDSGVVIAA